MELQEHRAISDPLRRELPVRRRPKFPQLIGRQHRKSHLTRFLEVFAGVQRPAEAGLDGGPRVDQALLERPPERGSVEVLLAEVTVPRVAVRIEVDERELAVNARKLSELREGDRVVTAEHEREDTGLYHRSRAQAVHGHR